jgi:hypothetical protein
MKYAVASVREKHAGANRRSEQGVSILPLSSARTLEWGETALFACFVVLVSKKFPRTRHALSLSLKLAFYMPEQGKLMR